MKKMFRKYVVATGLLICVSVCFNQFAWGQDLKLMTYNLKFASPTYEPSWEVRRDMQIDMIRKYDPDIIGKQEGLKEQIDYLAEHLPEYVVVGRSKRR